jgi:uncharacterized protein (UPF0276 family)
MEFAINFSHPAAELAKAGTIQVDRFKVPDWPDLIAMARECGKMYVHFGINAGANDSQTKDWALADRLAKETETPFVNLHLAARAKDFAIGDSKAVMERMTKDVQRAADFFRRERIIVENVPLGNTEESFAPACGDPAVISEIVRKTGVGFLLDLSHARMAARHLDIDEKEYVLRLPMERLRELHLTGLAIVDGRLRDHMPLSEEDWRMTYWAMNQISNGRWSTPGIVAFEYGGVGGPFEWRCDRGVIAEQVPRLYEMVHGIE